MKPRKWNWSRPTLALIAGSALAISSGTLIDLMIRLRWDEWQAWLIPVTIDVLAAYGVSEWLGAKGHRSKLGRRVAVACLVVSITGNAIEHVLASPVGWQWALLALFWGCLPPVSFFIAVHMYATAKGTITPRRQSGDKTVSRPGAPMTDPEAIHLVRMGEKRAGSDEEILAWLRSQPGTVTKRELMAAWKLGNTRALALLKQAA